MRRLSDRMREMISDSQRAVLVAIVVVGCAFSALAQSGRRGAGKSTTTTPSVEAPKEVLAKPQKPPRLQFLLVVENPSPFNQTPYYLSDTVVTECARRLEEAKDVLATSAPGHMNRAEASAAAKAEKERYVVWLQLGSDAADGGRPSQNGADELYVNYMVLEPGTAKVKQTGRTYHGIYKVGNVGVSGPPSTRRSAVYSEYAVKQSAREAADRILNVFGIKMDGPQRMPL
jgi:hypothetical protein